MPNASASMPQPGYVPYSASVSPVTTNVNTNVPNMMAGASRSIPQPSYAPYFASMAPETQVNSNPPYFRSVQRVTLQSNAPMPSTYVQQNVTAAFYVAKKNFFFV